MVWELWTWAISLLSLPFKKISFIDPATDRSGSLHMKWPVVFCALKVLISSICDVTSLSFSSFETGALPITWIPFLQLPCQGKHWDDSAKITFLPIYILTQRGNWLCYQRKLDVWSWRSVLKLSCIFFSLNITRWRWVVFLKCLSPAFWLLFYLAAFSARITGFMRTVFPLQPIFNTITTYFLEKQNKENLQSMSCE